MKLGKGKYRMAILLLGRNRIVCGTQGLHKPGEEQSTGKDPYRNL
jgi:hypothetical protein